MSGENVCYFYCRAWCNEWAKCWYCPNFELFLWTKHSYESHLYEGFTIVFWLNSKVWFTGPFSKWKLWPLKHKQVSSNFLTFSSYIFSKLNVNGETLLYFLYFLTFCVHVCVGYCWYLCIGVDCKHWSLSWPFSWWVLAWCNSLF